VKKARHLTRKTELAPPKRLRAEQQRVADKGSALVGEPAVSLDLRKLTTETPNLAAADLDTKSSLEIARIINNEDKKVANAVERALPQVAQAIDAIAAAIGNGGRLIYVGAGTSGRIAALDASECPPTFNVDPRTVQVVMAGGEAALSRAAEYNEDSRFAGEHDIAKLRPTKNDVVVGIAASGRTPYTIAAVEYAGRKGAKTVAVTCNPNSPLDKAADIGIVAEVGPEVVSGSTRMKAGTAQKLVLNMLTTGAMARLGYVYGNLMVNVHPRNQKLAERALSILQRIAGVGRDEAESALAAAGQSVPVALVMLRAGVTKSEAQRRLKAANGHVRKAMKS
jgi:N-acetylmuramic acid 6-phosphate etherase